MWHTPASRSQFMRMDKRGGVAGDGARGRGTIPVLSTTRVLQVWPHLFAKRPRPLVVCCRSGRVLAKHTEGPILAVELVRGEDAPLGPLLACECVKLDACLL